MWNDGLFYSIENWDCICKWGFLFQVYVNMQFWTNCPQALYALVEICRFARNRVRLWTMCTWYRIFKKYAYFTTLTIISKPKCNHSCSRSSTTRKKYLRIFFEICFMLEMWKNVGIAAFNVYLSSLLMAYFYDIQPEHFCCWRSKITFLVRIELWLTIHLHANV